MQGIQIVFDIEEAKAKIDELGILLREVFVDHLPDYIVEYLSSLSSDIIVTDGRATFRADAVLEKHLVIRCGSRFDEFVSALRAGEIDDFIHNGTP